MAFLASPEADRVTVEVTLNEDQVRLRLRAQILTGAHAHARACRLTHAYTC